MELSRVEIETRGRNSRKLLAYPSAVGLARNTQALGSFDRPDEGDILVLCEWPKCHAEIENIILDSISRTCPLEYYSAQSVLAAQSVSWPQNGQCRAYAWAYAYHRAPGHR